MQANYDAWAFGAALNLTGSLYAMEGDPQLQGSVLWLMTYDYGGPGPADDVSTLQQVCVRVHAHVRVHVRG